MRVEWTGEFEENYHGLPKRIKKKVDKQLKFLGDDFHHPSLHTKKVKGVKGIWEAWVDRKHRMTFSIRGEVIILRKVGGHEIIERTERASLEN